MLTCPVVAAVLTCPADAPVTAILRCHDIDGACQRAGVPCIGVLSGGISGEELQAAGAVRIYPGPAELLADFPASLVTARSG